MAVSNAGDTPKVAWSMFVMYLYKVCKADFGAMAQLVAHLHGMERVRVRIPLAPQLSRPPARAVFFVETTLFRGSACRTSKRLKVVETGYKVVRKVVKKTVMAGQAGIRSRSTSATTSPLPTVPSSVTIAENKNEYSRRSLRPRTNSTAGNSRSSYTPSSTHRTGAGILD